MRSPFLLAAAILAGGGGLLPAQPASSASFGSTVTVWSGHTTVRQRVDSGPDSQIELWNRSWIVSPSGTTYANLDHYGRGGSDGFGTTTVTLNEAGRWSWWTSDGGSIDSFSFGDGPGPWYMFPHNPPNGVGYGGAGAQLGSFMDVQPGAPTTHTLTTGVIGNGSVSGGGSHTSGTTATLVATPGGGATFSHWQGALSGSSNPGFLTMDADKTVTAVFTAANSPPTITWTSAPASAGSGQSYTVTARGHDADGNLTQVNVWKNGGPFAFAGGGNGSSNDSGNTTSDTGPASITFTAHAVDSAGATSGTISHTVMIGAANRAPTIAWSSAPAAVGSGQSYTVAARGHDEDGNLAQVNVWKNGAPFAFGGGGNGTDSDSGNSTSDTGPATVTFTSEAVDAGGERSATISHTVTVSAANRPPSIAWLATPGTVASGQSYTVTARGHDDDGNLAQVNVWKNGAPFAFAGGGNGFEGDSGNGTSDTGPATITFTAQATDAAGAASGTISQTVTVAAGNRAPTIAWTSAPGSVASGQSYTISARGHDDDGNLAQVNVWKNGTPFAFAGGGNGTDGDSGNTTADGGPASVVFTANAFDATGATSGTLTHTVTIAAPASVSASISTSPSSATAPGTTSVTWTSTNATGVAVSGPGLSSTSSNGTQSVTGLSAGTHTFTLVAQGAGGPVTHSASVVVTEPAAVSATISASPLSVAEPGTTTITWSSANATAVAVNGSGLGSTAANGSQTVTGLTAGNHDFTIVAQGPGGPATRTVSVSVTAAIAVSGTLSASPSSGTAPVATSIAWNTANATAVSVSGPGLGSASATGTQIVSGLTAGTHTFTLTAQGPGGPITRTATVTVSPALPPVSGTITATPTTATAPGSTTLTWSAGDATVVSVSGPGLASTATSGTQVVSGLPAGTHTFTLVAQGNGGPITRTATVVVDAGSNVTAAIGVAPTTMNVGDTATLTWSSSNASSVRVTGFGVTGSGFQNNANQVLNIGGLPQGQSTWTLIAEGPGGPLTRTATITVNSLDGLAGSLTANPPVIRSTQSATLAWTSSGANFRWLHGHQPTYNGVSVYPAPASGSTSVAGLAPGEYSFVFEYGPGAFSATRGAYAYLTVLGVDRSVTASVSPPGSGVVAGTGTYAEGASVTLTATPDASHLFNGWTGDISGSSNPLTFTVGPQNYALTANFVLRTFTVSAVVSPAGAGTVSGAGTYMIGSTAILSATPNATHAFGGWTGDLTSAANPLSFAVNANVALTANFIPTSFVLTTSATAGGTVTPGGAYPAGSVVTVSATSDGTHRFVDWTGDANGTAASVAVTMDRAKFVQANFAPKTSQTIAFAPIADRPVSSPPFALIATASSGLPVSFSLLGGPATLTGTLLEITGAGPVTVEASQSGDSFYLPAPPVSRTFNAISAATLKYRGQSRTLLRDESTPAPPPYVLEKP